MPNGQTDYKAAFESGGFNPDSLECKYSALASTVIHLMKEQEISKDSPTLYYLHQYLSKINRNAADTEVYYNIKDYIGIPREAETQVHDSVPHLRIERE